MDSEPYKKAFLENNIKYILELLTNNIIPKHEELIYILSKNENLADCLALRKIDELKNFLIFN